MCFALKVLPAYPLRNKASFPMETSGRGKARNMPAHTLGGLSFEDSFFPSQDCW